MNAEAPLQPSAPASAWRHILVAYDDSAPARRALDEAAALACSCGAALSLVNVFDAASHVSGFEPASVIDGVIERARAHANDSLHAACERATRRGAHAQAMIVDGGAVDVPMLIAAQARQLQADVVVIGTHGRRGLERLFKGSVAEGVLRRASVPVLLLHEAGD